MMRYILLFSGLLVFCFSCSSGNTSKDDISEADSVVINKKAVKIDLNNPLLEEGVVKLSDIASGIEYIPLETKEECLINKIQAIELAGSYVYVSTPKQLLLFDTAGRFVRRIGSSGNGPGEYNAVADIAVDKKDHSVYLINTLGKKIMHYSIEGEFLDSFPTDFNIVPDNIELYKGNIYLSFSDIINNTGDQNIRLMVAGFSRSGEIINTYESNLPAKENARVMLMLPCEVLYTYNNALMVKEVRNDTLYHMSGSGAFEPCYIFNYSEFKMPLEEYTYESFANRHLGGKYVYFLKVLENKASLFFTYKHHGNEIHWVYNKVSGKLSKYSSTPGYSGIPDDIKSGPGFWPVYSGGDNYLLGYIEPSLLSIGELNSLSDIAGDVDISSNPVLQIVSY